MKKIIMSPLRGLIEFCMFCYNHDVPPGLKKEECILLLSWRPCRDFS